MGEQAQVAGQGACCCWQQPEMLLQLALLVAPLGGAPAAPAPSPGVEEEGGRQASRLPGSIIAPLSRAELFQRPRPRNVADLSRRTPRPRSLGGRRLKGGS